MNHCFMSCKHKTLKSHIQRLGRGSEKLQYNESPELQFSCHKFCVGMDGLRSTLIWSKFKNYLGGACPQVPLERCALYVRKKKLHALHVPHGRTNPTLCVPPPFFNLLIRPCKEHRDSCDRGKMEKSAVAEHAWENHHSIHWEETTVLDHGRGQELLALDS